jgi:hypothetical protein
MRIYLCRETPMKTLDRFDSLDVGLVEFAIIIMIIFSFQSPNALQLALSQNLSYPQLAVMIAS